MDEFVAIDFETANPKRVSACAIGYAHVSDGVIVESDGQLIQPVGGHAPFQSKIHGIKEEHTFDKPDFRELYPDIRHIFAYPLVAHSLFDKQVLNALADHYDLRLQFSYTDTSALAKEQFPHLKNHKLKTLVKHFDLPAFKHHDATEDALACARVFLRLQGHTPVEEISIPKEDLYEFRGLAMGILADEEVNYKEAYELLYWLEDHGEFSDGHRELTQVTVKALDDDHLDHIEAADIKLLLQQALEALQ